jgi:hypothetical protein
VQLTVPRRGGWRAWGSVRADFERALADPPDPAIAAAEIASEHRRGADYVRVTIAMTVDARDVADALAIAWDAFTGVAADDLNGWDVTAAAAEVQPGPPLAGDPVRGRAIRSGRPISQGITSKHLPGSENARSGVVVVAAGTQGDPHDRLPPIDLPFPHIGLSVQHSSGGPRGP